jgi:hypothetical protein
VSSGATYKVDFDDDCFEWVNSLSLVKSVAVRAQFKYFVAMLGLNECCNLGLAENIGDSTYEVKVKQTEAELRRRAVSAKLLAEDDGPFEAALATESAESAPPTEAKRKKGKKAGKGSKDFELRLFACAYGDKIVFVVSGYDKKRTPSKQRQQQEIAKAKKLVAAHKAALKSEG